MTEIKSKEIKIVDVDSIIPNPKNNNRHNESQKKQLIKIIKHSGFRKPLTISNRSGFLVAGHLRLECAKELGMTQVPVMFQDYENDADEYLDMTADNAIAMQSEIDLSAINLDIADYGPFDIELLGLKDFKIDIAEKLEPKCDEDECPELKKESITKRGDVWILGNHRLMCGDSTMIDDVEKLTQKKEIDLILTDPPYEIKRDKGFGGFGGFGKPIARRTYQDDWDSDRPSKDFFDMILLSAKKSIIFGGNFFADTLPQGKHWLVWNKNNTMPTFGDCELAWTNIDRNSVKKYDFTYNGLIGKEKERFHPTQKPVGLFEKILEDYSEQKEIIFDMFSGSGTTLISCEKTNRTCFSMELSENYCDVIINRWKKYTEKEAVLESTGESFDFLSGSHSKEKEW